MALAVVTAPVPAAVPWSQGAKPVVVSAREQPLGAFLENVFAQVDSPVAISPNLNGQVSGRFRMPAQTLVQEIARAYGLVLFHDGLVTHVAPSREVQQRQFPLGPLALQRTLRNAEELQLTDAQNTLRRGADGTLVARGHPAFIEMVAELVRANDPSQPPASTVAATGREDFRVYYLRYAWAQDVSMSTGGRPVNVPGVASILRTLVGVQGGGNAPAARERPSTVPGLRGQGLAAQAAGGNGGGTLGLGHQGALAQDYGAPARGEAELMQAALQQPGVLRGREAAAPPAVPTAAAGPRIEADPRLNAVIVRDQPDRLDRYAALIQALDIEPQALEIEATVIDINTDRLRELGINWRWSSPGGSEFLFGNGSASDLALRGNREVTPRGKGGFISAVLGNRNNFVARISALQEDGAARVVSSPQVLTLSNVEAIFDSSSTFYVRVAGREQVDLFNVTAGTSLRVTPHVFTDRERTRIKLLVQVEDGNMTAAQVDQIPVVERSTIQTQALITEGESLLIGGMVRDSSSTGSTKVPVLGDVPVLGHLFRTNTDQRQRIERMFLITPRLAPAGRPAGDNPLRGAAPPPAGSAPLSSGSATVPQAAPPSGPATEAASPATTQPLREPGTAQPVALPPEPTANSAAPARGEMR
ncbi:type III secretion system outer membrane ring subunit SctC [Pelomonas sp. CA6]|uniref:type III secretion system outer membrane ring subunit SctC n=1 Tax=Pelomonas sp. CA6 TaxID=2907999 RepID=UPI001F4C405C|nr:type III secretion system outer membrane ring subunit SctC [Pelomonas sp. CA6]MCH7345083.1 type III secretion system outer membrane ring subunit SctC [Pelomonas sp. CA6]